MARYVAPPRVAELARSVAPSNANCGVDVSVDAMYTPPPSTAPLDSMTPPMTLSLAPTCATAPPKRAAAFDLTSHAFMVSAPTPETYTAPPSADAVFSLIVARVNVWLPAAMNSAPPRPAIVDSHPTAALSLNADAVAVICAPRGELVAASAGAGTTKTAPPLGAVLLRTVVVPAMASVVGAAGVFGSSANAPPPTAYNARQLEPLTARFPSMTEVSVNVAPHALVRYAPPPRPDATFSRTTTPEPMISPPPCSPPTHARPAPFAAVFAEISPPFSVNVAPVVTCAPPPVRLATLLSTRVLVRTSADRPSMRTPAPCLDATLDTTRELDTLAELCEYMKMPPPISAWFSSNANPLKSACAFV